MKLARTPTVPVVSALALSLAAPSAPAAVASEQATSSRTITPAARFGTIVPPCADPIDSAVKDGEPIEVDLSPYRFTVGRIDPRVWTDSPSKDPAWTMWFYSFRWAQQVARKAAAHGQDEAVARTVAQVQRFYTENPDTGRSVHGWDEGTSLRRLQTLNCLYHLSKDERIPAMMAVEVELQFGPRYYGPPYRRIHNHGLMANQFIITAGSLVGRADWIERAAQRMSNEIEGAFSTRGVSFEQSAAYHKDNHGQWAAYGRMIEEVLPGSPIPAKINAKLVRVAEASQWLTEPDGMVTSVGDSLRVPGVPGGRGKKPGAFRDEQTGWLAGRFSWKDPKTSYFVVRYGPKTWAHGHFDKSSVVWSTAGSRVLTGPGYSTYDPVSPTAPWWKKPYAHNVGVARGRALDAGATGRVTSFTNTGRVMTTVVRDRAYGVDHVRRVTVDDPGKRITVVDGWPRGVVSTQHFHLDHTWKLVSRSKSGLVARNSVTGKRVVMTTGGTISRVSVGSSRYQDGWQYLRFGERRNAIAIKIDSSYRNTATTFAVR